LLRWFQNEKPARCADSSMKPLLVALSLIVSLWGCSAEPHEFDFGPLGGNVLTTSPGGFLRLGEERYEFTRFFYEDVNDEFRGSYVNLAAKFGNDEDYLIVPVLDGRPTKEVQLLFNTVLMPVRRVEYQSIDPQSVKMRGRLDNGKLVVALIHTTAGTSTFRVDGNRAFLNGELGSGAYEQIEILIKHCPEVDTLVFENVPGSLNDDINVLTGRLIRDAGFTTWIPAHGVVASGGVSLFCAGNKRVIEEGAQLGVHAWSIPMSEVDPIELPREHQAHRKSLGYYREMLDKGEQFYFFTLDAAPFESVHWLTAEEVSKFGLEK
jgi:hypothetical protein